MKRRISSRRAGFTLFELMVVLSIMSVVSTIGVTGFFRMTGYWNDLQANMRLNSSISRAFASLADDFENMLSEKVCGIPVQGKQADIEDNVRFWRISFEDDSIVFPVEVYNPLTEQRERFAVTYAIERDSGTPRFTRTAEMLDTDSMAGTIVVVSTDIVGMRIHYFDGRVWHEHWDFPHAPRLVRVSLAAMDGVRVDRNMSRAASFTIQVQ